MQNLGVVQAESFLGKAVGELWGQDVRSSIDYPKINYLSVELPCLKFRAWHAPKIPKDRYAKLRKKSATDSEHKECRT